jgi:ribosome-associated protein
MDIRKLQRAIVDGLEDVKAQNIVVFNTEHLSSLFERVIIASGTSNRQTKSLASSVREAVKEAGYPVPRMEGETNGEWIIVDCGAAVVHVMQPTIRDYYHLEEIWGGKSVNMKIDSSKPKLVKASEPITAAAAKRAAGAKTAPGKATRTATKTVAAKAPAKRAPAKRVVAVKASTARNAPAGKTTPASKKAAAKRVLAPRSMVTRLVGVKKPVAKKGAVSKIASRAAPVRRPAAPKPAAAPARKSPATKAPAKKAPARKTASRA